MREQQVAGTETEDERDQAEKPEDPVRKGLETHPTECAESDDHEGGGQLAFADPAVTRVVRRDELAAQGDETVDVGAGECAERERGGVEWRRDVKDRSPV